MLNVARAGEGVNDILRVGADHVDLLDFSLALGFDAQFDGHPEESRSWFDLADGAEALVVAEAVNAYLLVNSRRACAVNPLPKRRE